MCQVADRKGLAATGEGIVQAFRQKDCPEQSITLKLRGLQIEKQYDLEYHDGPPPRTNAG